METVNELFTTGLSMYLLSYFVAIFDGKTSKFLRLVAYLNAMAIIIILGASVAAYGTKFITTIDNLSKWKPW